MTPGAPTVAQLQRLRALRLRAGLTLDDVAERTGLPVAHVEALEEGRTADLPSGPYIAAYHRLVLGAVGGVAESTDAPAPAPPPSRIPLVVVRAIALGSVFLLFAAMGWQVRERGLLGVEVVTEALAPAATEGPDLSVRVVPRRAVSLRVRVDGEIVVDGSVAPGVPREFHGRERIELDVPGAEAVAVAFNGRAIVPQGRQATPRRLIFVDDVAPGE